MHRTSELRLEAHEAIERVWFVQSMEEMEHTDPTLSLRLHIQPGVFVQAILGELTGSLYFALIYQGQRVFAIDRESDEWHVHLYDAPDRHELLPEGLGPRPLLEFLGRVEELLLQHHLL